MKNEHLKQQAPREA
uniref:Uncharacterized protein n=1 Tax=Anguilla anguilla TaxID=7936 RepID=A0A0E9SUE5_ANGAN